jgi:hypothetical protein
LKRDPEGAQIPKSDIFGRYIEFLVSNIFDAFFP